MPLKLGEKDVHGFDAYEHTVRGVLFFMLAFKFYKYSNDMPLMAVDHYIADYGYEVWQERQSKCNAETEETCGGPT